MREGGDSDRQWSREDRRDHDDTREIPGAIDYARTGELAQLALVFAAGGNPRAWDASAAWWPLGVTLANLVSIALLAFFARREGMRLRDLYRVGPVRFWRDLGLSAAALAIAAPLMLVPDIGVGTLLWGSMDVPTALFYRPLPAWALYPGLVVFPLTIAFVELPTYFTCVMPRLSALSGRGIAAALLTGLALCVRWRPRLLPFLMAGHALLDSTLLLTILTMYPV